MKIISFLSALLLVGRLALAQDTIVQTNGSKIVGVVQEVGTTEIKYKKYSTQQTSPVYDIEKYKVSMIKYADGTKDVFPVTPAPTPAPATSTVIYSNYPYSPYPVTVDTNFPITGAYVYFGGMISPLNLYDGTPINNYWNNLYSYESTPPNIKQLNTGNALTYSFYMGGTMVFHKVSNWSYEFQFEYTPNPAVLDSVSYPDGTHGSISIKYMMLNDAIQYTHNMDTAGRFQFGGEVSLDIGLTFGSEHDVFYNSPSSSYYYTPSTSQSFDGVHVGSHFALVGKYFVNKAKTIGFEGRLGYRFMNFGPSAFDDALSGYNGGLNLSGAFASIGLVIRLHSTYSVSYGDQYYYGE
jgi:hypothetical protein